MEFSLASTIVSAAAGSAFGAFANSLTQGRARWVETQRLATALAREIMMCGRKLAAWRFKIEEERRLALHRTRVAPCPLTAGDFALYHANAASLGKLPPWLVIRTMQIYERFRSFSTEHGSEQFRERAECEELLERIQEALHFIDARVFTELEILAATSYLTMIRFRLTRSDRRGGRYEGRPKRYGVLRRLDRRLAQTRTNGSGGNS